MELAVALRVALVGCGAVSEVLWVPALRRIPELSIEWFVDPTIERARQLSKKCGQGNATRTHEETIAKVDAAIVAVPNFLHAGISIDFLNAGRDVLCEKPLATSVQEGLEMIRASRKSGARLAVNLIRRRYDNYRITKELMSRGLIGNITRVTVEEGDILAWPFASSFMLEKRKAGGGTLIDWGSHAIDILHWLFAGDCSVLSYTDDALGGIEADCEADLEIRNEGHRIPCNVKLSRVRKLRNSTIVQGDAGSLEVRPFDLGRVHISVGDCVAQLERDKSLGHKSQEDYFVDQIMAFTDRSRTDFTDGSDALESLRVIEECYRKKQNVIYPWEKPIQSDAGRSISSQYRKILVVGASGFVGTKLCERLTLDLGVRVRAAIHRPETAARLARLPVEFVDCDLLERSQVMKSVDGCDVIVNLSRDRSGDGKKTLDVLVRGTENLLEAAARYGIKKFVHTSSAAVHGFKHKPGAIDECASFRVGSDQYVRGKIRSEELVMNYAQILPVVIIRPTLIYGPFSADWVVGIIQRMRNRLVTLVGENKRANLTFVDNVAEAILLAIEKKEANGQAFIINDDEQTMTWTEYVQWYSDMLGIPAVAVPDMSHISLAYKEIGSLLKDSAVVVKDVIRSPELLALIARIPIANMLGAKVFGSERRNKLGLKLRSSMEAPKYEPEAMFKYSMTSRDLHSVLSTSAVFSASKAKGLLGFRPCISLADGMTRTSMWIKWARLA